MTTINTLGVGQRGFYLGLGLAVGLGFAAHGASAGVAGTACRPASTSKPPAAVSQRAPAQQAQTLVSNGHRWQLTLKRVAVVPQLRGTLGTYHAHGTYVVVFLDAQNSGRVPQTLSWDQNFALVDAQGRRFSANSDATIAAAGQYNLTRAYEEMQPTLSARLAFAFDVARGAHGFTLVNVSLSDDRTQKLFGLGL